MSVTNKTHNLPAIDLYAALAPDELRLFLDDRFSPRQARVMELMASHVKFLAATAQGIPDALWGRCTDHIKQLRQEVNEIDETRVAIKAPVLAAGRQIDGHARSLTEPLLEAVKEGERRGSVYLRAKDAAIREEAALRAQEAAAEAARLTDLASETGDRAIEDEATAVMAEADQAIETLQAAPQDLTRTRTDLGTTASLRDNWQFEVRNFDKVPHKYLQLNEAAIRAAIRTGVRDIPGLKIVNNPKVGIR